MRTLTLSATCGIALLAGCAEELQPPVKPPRPVSFVTLQSSAPEATARLAGTVEAWKRVETGFQVPGRVISMTDAGTEIQGDTLDASEKLVAPATVIAKLDDARYQIALNEKEALLAAAKATLDAARTTLESTLPEKLKAAEADLALQEKEVERFTRMVAENSAPQERFDQVVAAFDVAQATVAEVRALIVTQGATVAAAEAQVRLSEEMVAQAQLNIEYCTLVAPFAGQVSQVHVIPGGYVLRGQRVATLQMMDPVKVQVALSPRRDAQLRYNEEVTIYLPDSDRTLNGYVYLKDTFADPATRTFLATILLRNHRVGDDDAARDESRPRATELLRLEKRDPDRPGAYFVELSALYEDESGFYVWKAESVDTVAAAGATRVKARRVQVTPGDGVLDFVQLFTFRELTDHGGLDPVNDLVLRGVSGDVQDGTVVELGRERWLLRPGDVVTAGLKDAGLEAGFYVPEEAIQFDGQGHCVYTIRAGDGGSDAAARVEVRIGETVGRLQRIEAVGASPLTDGMRVVLDGAHYVVDGEAVNPMEDVVPRR
jgi:multidrug efflux pump subunit AcrA (membrane-fusion protein)